MSKRAVKYVRQSLGIKLRALRKARRLSQEKLGELSGLSGKFIGEVERGEKSISIDSLWGVAMALEIPLRGLTDMEGKPPTERDQTIAKITALLGRRKQEDIAKVLQLIQAFFSKG